MKRWVRWFLVVVFSLNAVGAALLLEGSASQANPAAESADAAGESEGAAEEAGSDREALKLLGRQLAERAEELSRREAELDELIRSQEVLLRAEGLDPTTEPEPDRPVEPVAATQPAPVEEDAGDDFAFEKLRLAYENMEPESAAVALAELAALDQQAVVQLLLGWKPRTSGAILDALTQTHAELAAKLSYEIWKQGGKGASAAARNSR